MIKFQFNSILIIILDSVKLNNIHVEALIRYSSITYP